MPRRCETSDSRVLMLRAAAGALSAASGRTRSSQLRHTTASLGACLRDDRAARRRSGRRWWISRPQRPESEDSRPPASTKIVFWEIQALRLLVGVTASPRKTSPASSSGSSPDLITVVVFALPSGPRKSTRGSRPSFDRAPRADAASLPLSEAKAASISATSSAPALGGAAGRLSRYAAMVPAPTRPSIQRLPRSTHRSARPCPSTEPRNQMVTA